MNKSLYIIAITLGAYFSHAQYSDISDIQATVQPNVDIATLKENLQEQTLTNFMECHALGYTLNANSNDAIFQNGSYYWKISGNGLGIRAFLNINSLPHQDSIFVLNAFGERIQYLVTEDLFQKKWSTTVVNDELTIQYKPISTSHIPEILLRSYSLEVPKQTFSNTDDFGGSQACEVNINCPEGSNYQDVKNSVVRILIKIGSAYFWCSGSLINNTAYDYKPYILTAEHCAIHGSNFATSQDIGDWVFYFQYEGPNCTNPSSEGSLGNKQITGATLLANSNDNGGDSGSDFLLLELSSGVPVNFNPFFAGWSRLNTPPGSGVTIHHPQGDIRKISTSTTPAISGVYPGSSASNTHWVIKWSATVTNHGVTEGGSSGSPFFNENNLISGTLTGGRSSCSQNTLDDYYGKFSYHWDQNGTTANRRLKDWLDPGNTGVSILSGATLGDSAPPYDPSKIKIKPNPVTEGKLFIEGLPVVGDRIIQIFDLQGNLVYPKNESVPYSNIEQDGYIQVNYLPNGPYVLRILNNGKPQSFKFIINN